MNASAWPGIEGLVGCEPPEPLTVSWLAALANLKKEEERRLLDAESAGHVIEEMHVVKRAGQWASTFHLIEQRLLEREFRFYTELAFIFAQAEANSFELKASKSAIKEERDFAMDALSQVPLRHLKRSSMQLKNMTKTSSSIIGGVQDVSGLRSVSMEGCFEVLRPRVSIHTAPSVKASLLGALPRHTLIRGFAFAAEDGEPWLLLHRDTRDDIDLHREGAFVPIASKSLGCGSLLKRLPGDPIPARDSWRPSKSTNAEVTILNPIECWKRFIQRRLMGSLRVPVCVAASYKGHWSTFLILLEKLSAPEWVSVDLAKGCTVSQAYGAVVALAGLHSTFSEAGKLSGLAWLPSLPLHEENIGQIQATYCKHFNRNRAHLSSCMSPSAFTVCEKLCHLYSDVAKALAQPPVTLLHGNFHPGVLRFSVASNPPAVAAYDWEFVCRGRAGYDFAMFLALFAPPHVRRECEVELMIRYLMARDLYGSGARESFKDEVRMGLLMAFVFYFLHHACVIGTSSDATVDVMRGLEWFSIAIDDWDCDNHVGGTDSPKAARMKRGYKKKSRRIPVSPEMLARSQAKLKTKEQKSRSPLQRRSSRQ